MAVETKRPLILFSGGMDSTYLLQTTLYWGPCDVLYVRGGQHSAKVTKEQDARRKIIDTLNECYGYKVTREYEPAGRLSFASVKQRKYSQPVSWLMGALQVLDPDRHSKLLVGYVGDDGFGFGRLMPEIEKIWYSAQKLIHTGEPIPIEFPLDHVTKREILHHLDTRLVNHIWVCEQPERKYPKDRPPTEKADELETLDDEPLILVDDPMSVQLATEITTDEVYDVEPCGRCAPCRKMRIVLDEYRQDKGETIFTTALKANRARTRASVKGEGPSNDVNHEFETYRLVRDHHDC